MKINNAKKLYMEFHNLPRKQLIQKFVKVLNMSENSARTHISKCAKELNPIIGKPFVTRNINLSNLKREKAKQCFMDNSTLTRSEIIKLFVKKFDMTENSAATHCSMFSKL